MFANTFLPVGVFNLSITPGDEIQKTNARMETAYHPDGGRWHRRLMPRTVLVFINDDPAQAAAEACAAVELLARAGRDARRGEGAAGHRQRADRRCVDDRSAVRERFHPEDRLMLWFDFNNHDSKRVMKNMEDFMTKVAPAIA